MSETIPDWETFELETSAGQPLSLPISPGPATGYSWSLSLPAGVTQTEDAPPREVPDPHRVGGSVRGALRVVAKTGDHMIEAKLIRPWMPDQPIRRVRIRVRAS